VIKVALRGLAGRKLRALLRAQSDKIRRASDDPKVMAMVEHGAKLGWLWSEGYLTAADPSAGE
jgi:hypothetical protein